jgi:hypothetical protein
VAEAGDALSLLRSLIDSRNLLANNKGRGCPGERSGQTGWKPRPLWEEGRTSPVHGGRQKHSRRPPKMFIAAAVNIRSVR